MVASEEAQVGFHAAVNQETGHEGLGSALMGKYFADLGLDDETIMWMIEKDPEHLNFLSLEVIRQLRLTMKLYDSEKHEMYDIQGGVRYYTKIRESRLSASANIPNEQRSLLR